MSAPAGQRHDRADVLALDVERPALGDLAGPNAAASASAAGSPQRRRRRSTTSHGRRVRRRREVVGERLGDAPAGRPARRGASRSRRGTRRRRRSRWRSAGPASASTSCAVAHRGLGQASSGSTSWRCMSGTIATGSASGRRVGRDDDERLLVGVRAVRVPPRPMEGPAGERRRPRVAGREGVPGRRGDVVDGAPLDLQGGSTRSRQAPRRLVRGRRRTGRLRVKGQGGHGQNASTGSGNGCGGNLAQNPTWRYVRRSA